MKIYNRIYILGPAGSGKSYLAKKISEKLHLPLKDMDDVRFVRKFSQARIKTKRKKLVDAILKTNKWVIDARGTDWDRHAMLKADLIILMRIPFYGRTKNIVKRYFERKNSDIDEKFRDLYSLIKYSLSYRYGKRKTSFKNTNAFLKKHHLKPKILKNRKEVKELLENL